MRNPVLRTVGLAVLTALHGATATGSPPATVQLTPNSLPDAAWTDVAAFVVDPAASRVVYRSDPVGEGAYQLFSVPIDGGVTAEVSHAAATGSIQEYKITGDGSRVVYRASSMLHSSLIDGGGNVLLSGTSQPFSCWVLSPDGSSVAYISGPEPGPDWCPNCSGPWVYAVPAAGGTPSVIGGESWTSWGASCPLVASPGGQWLAYTDHPSGTTSETRVTTWNGSDDALNSGFEAPFYQFTANDGWIVVNQGSFGISSHNLVTGATGGAGVSWSFGPALTPVPVQARYRAVYTPLVFPVRVYSREIGFTAPPVVLHEGQVCCPSFLIASDGLRVVLRDGGDLFSVPTLGGSVVQLNGAQGQVGDFQIAPDGQRVVYAADELDPGVTELFVVDVAAGAPLRISTALPSWGDVEGFRISSDGTRVVYRADVTEDSAFQLFSVPLLGGQSLEIGSDIEADEPRTVRNDMSIAPGDGRVVYRTGFVDGSAPPAEVLFSVALDTDGDGDAVLDSADCDSGDGLVWAVPGEVTALTLGVQAGAPEVTVLEWTPPGEPGGQDVRYDVLRTSTAAGFAMPGDITCVLSGGEDPAALDPEVPQDVFYYLARAVNACGNGVGGAGHAAADAHVCE